MQLQSYFKYFILIFNCKLFRVFFFYLYSDSVQIRGKIFDTIEIPTPKEPFITLEILSREKNIIKGIKYFYHLGIHVISLANKNVIKLGRGHDSDIRITDISVSRCHSILK